MNATLRSFASALLFLGSAALTLRALDVTYTTGQTATGTIINNNPDTLLFEFNASAGSASITNNSGLYFDNTATAGSASITNSGNLIFYSTSTAGSATIINNGGTIDLSFHTGGLSIGALGGSGGTVNLGNRVLTVGGLNTSSTFSGVISDTGGSLVKAGAGTFTLSGANTYTGGTTVSSGTLKMGATNSLPSGGVVTLGGGTLNLGNVTQSGPGVLDLTSAGGTIDFGTTGTISFADSAGQNWNGGILTLLNYSNGASQIRFGTNDNSDQLALFSTQLTSIVATGWGGFYLDSSGYLLAAIPEPSTYALIAGLCALLLTAWRRRQNSGPAKT